MSAIDKKRWMFVDISSVDLSKLSKEELISLREFAKARMNKHAAHLIRILRMGIEFLTDGELHVLRNDAQQLLEIKAGEWSLEKVKEEAGKLFELAKTAYVQSSLPVKPDHVEVNQLCVDIAKCWRRTQKEDFKSLEKTDHEGN